MKFDKKLLNSKRSSETHSDQRLSDAVNDLTTKKRFSSRSVAPLFMDRKQSGSGNIKNNSGSMRREIKTPK